MYFYDVLTAVASVRAFWSGIAGNFPAGTSIQTENSGDIIEDSTGDLTGAWTAEAVMAVAGVGPTEHAAPCGLQIRWDTAIVVHGHRLRGRTFVVPISNTNYQADGTIVEGSRAATLVVAEALLAAQNASFAIWHRPRLARPADGSVPAVEARVGSSALVTAASVPNKVVVLRSRRD